MPYEWQEGLEQLPDNAKVTKMAEVLVAIQHDKEKFYGSSWKGKGEYRGILANIDRKYDRLDKIATDEVNGKMEKLPTETVLTDEQKLRVGESKIDAVADLANYCLLYMTWLQEQHPGAFDHWLDTNVPHHLKSALGLGKNSTPKNVQEVDELLPASPKRIIPKPMIPIRPTHEEVPDIRFDN